MEAKEEVRSRLNIEDVIGEYVQLKRAGRNFKGLSPFSGEKTPSFFVSPDKQIWHDFSSNKGGDIYSFVMEVEGLDFRATLELLARKAGVDLSMYESTSSRDFSQKKQRLLSAVNLAATFYQRQLFTSAGAIEYVSKKRGLNKQVVHDFRIGYAPNASDSLMNFLMGKGYAKTELHDAGLIGSRGTDMFRNRMMVSLADGQGQAIGFTARQVDDDANGPKYINTPQTLLYDKGRHVFGLHLAKEAIRTSDYAVVVEGNMDVISSHQSGVKQVVATAGTALTEHHLKALSRLTPHIRLCFDGDKAGIAATERAIPIAQTVGVELSIITLPGEAKDPDELIRQDISAWVAAIDNARPALEWLIEQYKARVDVTTAAGKRELSTQALNVLARIDNPVEREHYLRQISEATGTTLGALEERLDQLIMPDEKRLKPIKVEPSVNKDEYAYQDYLLALMAIEPAVHDVVKKMKTEELEGDDRQELFSFLLDDPDGLKKQVPPELHKIETYVKIVLLKAETRYMNLDGQDRLVEAVSLVRQVKEQHRKKKKQQLTTLLREAENEQDSARIARLQSELNTLIKEDRT
jgi:DNA primase